ncbi:MAG TPA: tetrahydrofolate synthase [Flavobacteriales bacterium]|nr:tetrahydrofolate synthase [Flavobacteriales bacterium]
MTYAEATTWLFKQLPMFQRQGAPAYKTNLSGTWQVLDVMGRPDLRLDHVIHVAGTNGKGSVCRAVANALQASGKRVGLFTSPHLVDFRERMLINGVMPDEQWVVDFIQRVRSDFESAGNVPSFFEWTFGMALVWFVEKGVDVVVLETGMGGRLDSTNVFPQPLLTVITNIGLDHQHFLGNDIRSIAREKAGIIKDGVPLVIGRMRPDAQSVLLETANRYGAEVHYAGVAGKTSEDGPHWPENRATAKKALEVLNEMPFGCGWEVPGLDFITKSGHDGRWQWLKSASSGARILLDCAHNLDGLNRTLGAIQNQDFDMLRIVYGAMNDKDIQGALSLMPRQGTYYFCQTQSPRAFPADELFNCAGKNGLQGVAFPTVEKAVIAASSEAESNDLVLVLGSVFIVGEAITWDRGRE